jgi:hypothetical protein
LARAGAKRRRDDPRFELALRRRLQAVLPAKDPALAQAMAVVNAKPAIVATPIGAC